MSQLFSKTSTVLLVLALGALPGAAAAGTCGVLPFSASDDVNRGAAPNITALVSSELDIRGGYDLVMAAPAEDFEGGDCGASTNCIKEFGRANKHEAVVSGRVVTDGDEYALTIKLHDGNTAAVIREVSRNVPTSALALADAVSGVVVELVTGKAPASDEDAAAAASEGPLFDDVDLDELLDEAEAEVDRSSKKKRTSRAAPRNPDRDEREMDLDEEDDDLYGIGELDALDLSPEQLEKQKREREKQAELDRARKEEEERLARARAEEERARRIAEEREREERERARAEREERERLARIEAERREEAERQARIREEREREERDKARAERDRREREEAERQARADREDRERRDRERMDREARQRDEDERLARADRTQRERDAQAQREREERERRERDRAVDLDEDDGGDLVLGSALALGPASGIIIGGDDDDDDEGGFSIGPADDDEDDYEVEDEEPREGMIIGDDDKENPNVRRRREASESRDDDASADDRYSRARSFGSSSSSSSDRDRDRRAVDEDEATASSRRYDDRDEDLDVIDEDDGRSPRDRDYGDRSYRASGSEPVASRDDAYLASDYDDRDARSYTARRNGGTKASSRVKRSDTGWGNRPWFSARVAGGYTNYYLHFAQYGVDLGVFPIPRVSVDLQADFWTLSIRECAECEQQYRTLPSFYLGGSYRFTNLKIVQPYVGGDVGTIVYAIGTLTADDGTITRRPLMGVAFEVKGGADFMFTRHFGIGAGVKAGVAYASRIKENVHPDWNPLQFLVNVRIAAVVQF
jgi:hypothetical protein